MRRLIAPLLAVLLVGCALPAGASAAIRDVYVSVKGAPGPGPSKYDKVFVEKIGPKNAKRVLVLVPGYMGGAGDFSLIGRDIVKRVPGMQVWALDRREAAFEDTSVFRKSDPDAAFRYYLNFQPVNGRTFAPVDGKSVPYVRQWGLKLALDDLRRVILEARAGGRRTVILGGHSLGASTTAAYATWDFNGRPGYKDVAGLVLIDGGLLGTFSAPTLKKVKEREAALKKGDPFVSLLSGLPPWSAGAFAETAALYAHRRPYTASVLQTFPLIPKSVMPVVPRQQPGRAGLRLRRRLLAVVPVDRPGQLGPAGHERHATQVGGRRHDADRPARGDAHPRAGQLHRLVLPAEADARRRRRQPPDPQRDHEAPRAADLASGATSTGRCTHSRRASPTAGCCRARGGSSRPRR